MILDKYDDLRLILANMMRDDKQCNTLGKGSDNMEKYLQQIVKFFDISVVSVSLPSDEEIREPIQNAIYATERFTTDQCTEFADGILAYLDEAGYKVVRQ